MSSKDPVQEGMLPSLENRRKILECARQVLTHARMVTDELDRWQRRPKAGSSASRFSVGLPAPSGEVVSGHYP